ncbi:hypothetical protein A2U01_0059236, partial [Trifolium medium]|nr:hypothetical protein [Trifolium medium]
MEAGGDGSVQLWDVERGREFPNGEAGIRPLHYVAEDPPKFFAILESVETKWVINA